MLGCYDAEIFYDPVALAYVSLTDKDFGIILP